MKVLLHFRREKRPRPVALAPAVKWLVLAAAGAAFAAAITLMQRHYLAGEGYASGRVVVVWVGAAGWLFVCLAQAFRRKQ